MDHDPVGEAIRFAFDEASEPVTMEEVATRRDAGAPHPRSPRAGWAVAVAASLMVIGGIAVMVRVTAPTDPAPIAQPAVPSTSVPGSESPSTHATWPASSSTTTIPTMGPTVIESAGLDGWSAVEIPTGLASCQTLMMWTGREIVIWGGSECPLAPGGERGFTFDADKSTWRTLPLSPITPREGQASVWSGSEMIVCCGSGSPTGAAYDPSADMWRSIPDSPLPAPNDSHFEAVWTGTEMLVVGQTGAAAYDPRSDTWRTFDSPPDPVTGPGRFNEVVWTGSVAVIWPTPPARIRSVGLTLDPASGEWAALPAPPAWPAIPDLVWTGDEVIVWGGLPARTAYSSERAVGSRLDLATATWTEMSEPLPEPKPCECNLGSQALLWTGEELIVLSGQFGTGANVNRSLLLSYWPDTDQWTSGESPVGWGAEGMMAGDRIVFRSDRLYFSDPGWVARGEPIDGPLQPRRVTYENPPRGFRIIHPSVWYRESADLTPRVGPSMLIAVGTSRPSPGGPRCSHMPVQAMEDMGPTDVFIQLEDWGVGSTDAAPRPATFGSLLAGIDSGSDAWNCLSPAAQAEIGVLRWFPFQDQGRSFLLLVVIGTEASSEDRAEAAAILDSIEIEPA